MKFVTENFSSIVQYVHQKGQRMHQDTHYLRPKNYKKLWEGTLPHTPNPYYRRLHSTAQAHGRLNSQF